MSSSQSHTVCLREDEQLCESGDKAIGGDVVGGTECTGKLMNKTV